MPDSRLQSNPTARRSGSFHAPHEHGQVVERGRDLKFGIGAALFALLATASIASASTLPNPSQASAEPSPTAAATGLPVTYPLSVTDDEGTAITLEAQPRRIASLSPSNTEIMFALGEGDQLVGGTDADDYPAEAAALPDVVVQTKVQAEQIVELDPDLILANGNGLTPQADIDHLRGLGYPVMVLSATSLDGVEKDIELIATVLNDEESGNAIATTMANQIQQVEDALAGTSSTPRTLYEIGYGPDIYAPPDDSPYAEMIRIAKGVPVSGDDSYVIPLEKLVQADPEVILLGDAAYGTCPGDVASRSGWQDITAVKNGALRPANDLVITRPGPRMPLGLVSIARGIHPEVSLSEFPPEPSLCTPEASPAPSAGSAP
jgi:iron complex transport system substrate-binding protein